jgi:hypothetical protein
MLAMLSQADRARIKVDLAALKKFREACTDSGLQKLIDGWIKEAKQKLADSAEKHPATPKRRAS